MTQLKPKYIPLTQKPCCCNVTCLQMILYRRGLGLFDQQKLARYFRIKVGKKDQKAFNVRLSIYTRINYDEGLKTIESEEIINRFFEQRKISLTAKAVKASEIRDLNKFIMDNLLADNDLWTEYKAHRIHGYDSDQGRYIHDGLVEELVEGRSSQVIMIDPNGRHKPRIRVSTRILAQAISSKFGRETGFIVISNK